MDDKDQLIMAFYALRLVAVSVLPVLPISKRVDLSFTTRPFLVSSAVGRNLSFLIFRRSRILYVVYLGLHRYLRNGGRSRLEIGVGFREGAVSASTLLALYRYCVAYFQ